MNEIDTEPVRSFQSLLKDFETLWVRVFSMK